MGRGVHIVLPGLIIAVMVEISACTHAPVAPAPAAVMPVPASAEQQARVPDEYLVTLAPNVDEAIIYEYYGRFGIKYLHGLEGETFLLILSNDPGPLRMEALIYDDSRIKAVQPNIISWSYR